MSDLSHGEPSQKPERQRDPCLRWERRVAAREEQPQPVMLDRPVRSGGVSLRAVKAAWCFASRSFSRRRRSIARLPAVTVSRPPGLGGNCRTHPARRAMNRQQVVRHFVSSVLGGSDASYSYNDRAPADTTVKSSRHRPRNVCSNLDHSWPHGSQNQPCLGTYFPSPRRPVSVDVAKSGLM